MQNKLIDFWRKCRLDTAPYAHPEDLRILRQKDDRFVDIEPLRFDTFLASKRFGDFTDHRLHLSLLPVPYAGDLTCAEVVILLLNPGFSYIDYWAETHMPTFRKRLEDNLRQSFDGVEFPFMGLDPNFCWYGGFVWWEKKLRPVITAIAARKFEGRYLDALRFLSRRLACIELVPYHSPSFRAHCLIEQLPSVKMAQDFVRDKLVPDANSDKRTLIITRQSRSWGLPDSTRNVVIYKGGHTRGASLSTNSEGGKAILERFAVT